MMDKHPKVRPAAVGGLVGGWEWRVSAMVQRLEWVYDQKVWSPVPISGPAGKYVGLESE